MIENARLKNAIQLSCRINAYIPATIHDKEINNTEFVDKIAKLFSKLFGGATSTAALGYWLSDSVGIIKEKTTIVFAYCETEQLKNGIEEVLDVLTELKEELKQEAMALEINGTMYFI